MVMLKSDTLTTNCSLPYIFAYWVILHAFLSSAFFFSNHLFRKILSGIPSECQTVGIQIRPDVLSGMKNVRPDLGLNCLQMLSADGTST